MMSRRALVPLICCMAAVQWGCASAPAPAPPPIAAVKAEPRLPEQLAYRITHSLAGHVGDLAFAVSVTRGPQGQKLWTGHGHGGGSFLGIGTKSRFSTTFDPSTQHASAWTLHRDTGNAVILDECSQAQPGVITTHRQRSDRPEEWATLQAGAPTYDPLSFLMALRTRGAGKWSVPVLEGRALWHVTATPLQVETIQWGGRVVKALRYNLHALPLDWQRQPSKTRKPRDFTVWLANTPERTPLVMKTSAPLGEVRLELQAPAIAQRLQ